MVRQFFCLKDVQSILAIELPSTYEKQDFLYWYAHSLSNFTLKSVYAMLSKVPSQLNEQGSNKSNGFKTIWHLPIHPNWKVFIRNRKMVQNKLPTRANLLARCITLNPNCYQCSHILEDQHHIFKNCHQATMFWSHNPLLLPPTQYGPSSQTEWIITYILLFRSEDGLHSERLIKFIISLWSLSIPRNDHGLGDGQGIPMMSQQRFSHLFSFHL